MCSDEVWRYVDWDFLSNKLFVLGPLILRQGLKEVPIGGFVSAQLAELWCLWREWHALTQATDATSKNWLVEYTRVSREEKVIFDNNDVLFLTPDNCDKFLASVGAQAMVQNRSVAHSPDIARVGVEDLHCDGFDGWWQPLDVLVGGFTLDGNTISLVAPSPWDGAVGGRLEPIIQMTNNANKARVRSFFGNCTTLRCVVGETLGAGSRSVNAGYP